MKTDYEHFYFRQAITDQQKPIWIPFHGKTNTNYGTIDFHLYWNTWVFSPHPLAVLSSAELKDIMDFLDQLNSSQNNA